jgi:hypothetical protein
MTSSQDIQNGWLLSGQTSIVKWVSASLESISCLCTVIQVKPSHAICAAKVYIL